MKPGDIVNFSLRTHDRIKDYVPLAVMRNRNHVCKVEIMSMEPSRSIEEGVQRSGRSFFICRRVDNGTPVLAWSEDLSE